MKLDNKHLIFFTAGTDIGGVERVFANYANLLTKEGFRITFLSCHEEGVISNCLVPEVNNVCLHSGRLRTSVTNIAKFLRDSDAGYVFTYNASTLLLLMAKCISNSKIRIIGSQHNYVNSEHCSVFEKYLNWPIYNLCYKVIAISDGLERHLLEHKVKKEKIIKLYNPIDFNRIVDLSEGPVEEILPDNYIVYVGRLSIVKRLPLLLKAFKKIDNENLNLVIVGDGTEKESLIKLSHEIGISSRVMFVGSKENPYPYIKNSRVVALSSESEAFPTILLESLILGKTIVSTPVPGSIEILQNGKLGYISASHDLQDYTDRLQLALNNPMHPEYLRDSVENIYSPAKTIGKLKSIIEN